MIALSICSYIGVQAAEISGKISYFPVVTGDMPEASRKFLVSKMEQALTQNGYGTLNRTDRFVLLAKCNVLQKDVTPTTPPRISQKVEVTFILGDAVENKTYASASIELSGIGINETKAWQTALNVLKPANPIFKEMLGEASNKIEAYYSEHCESIISKARTLASTGKSEEAIASLMAIPDICNTCYEKSMEVACEIYQNMIDAEGESLLSKAKNAWLVSSDEKGAELAMTYLNEIPVASSAFAEAETFAKRISKELSDEKERQWQFKLQQYNDEKEFRNREQANRHSYSMATIAAARSVGEKWAQNQPQTKVYLKW